MTSIARIDNPATDARNLVTDDGRVFIDLDAYIAHQVAGITRQVFAFTPEENADPRNILAVEISLSILNTLKDTADNVRMEYAFSLPDANR